MISKVDLSRKYRKENPDMPTLKLARVMYNDNPLLFTTLEAARTSLRYIEGKSGDEKRKFVQGSGLLMKEDRVKNPYNLPASDETDYKPFKLKASRLLLLSDIHVPYHSIEALTATFNFAKKEKPDAILLNGDTLDFFGLSKFCKDPRKRSFADELNAFKSLIEVIQKTFPGAKLYFKMGNHEERYFHFLWMKAKELVGVPEFELENIIKARANGITIISDKRIISANGLNIIHGHEFASGFFSPVNVARGLFLRGKTSAIQGHNHQTSEHTESDMNGKITTTWSTGCLCELHPEYMPINKWNLGFAIVEMGNGMFDVRNKRITQGRVL